MDTGSRTTTPILTPTELAAYLKLSKTSIYRLIEKRAIPFYKIGGSIRFDKDEITAFIRSNRIEPLSQ